MNSLGIATTSFPSVLPSFVAGLSDTLFQPLVALELAEHAACGYSRYLYPARAEHEGGWRWATSIDAGATQVYFAWNESYGVVSCRGSDQAADWFENGLMCRVDNPVLDATGTPFPGKVHGGFARQFRRVEVPVMRTLGYAKIDAANAEGGPGKQRWFVCGHSLGGALATLIAAYMRTDGFDVQAVYTFGSPRVGDGNWGAWYDEIGLNAATRRVVIVRHGHQDIVTRLPLSTGGWVHVGTPDILLSNGKVEHVEGEGAWQYVRSMQRTSWLTHLRIYSQIRSGALQHKISVTLEALTRLCGLDGLELED